jgi:uncharacterized protein YmfQ (DUF2313 family)
MYMNGVFPQTVFPAGSFPPGAFPAAVTSVLETLAIAYARAKIDLLPTGERAWPRDEDTVLFALMLALAQGDARLDIAAQGLVDESIPLDADRTLDQWEAMLALPDACLPEPADDDERRQTIDSRYNAQGGINPQFYLDLAASVGVPSAEIITYPPPAGGFTMGDDVGTEVGTGLSFVWTMRAPAAEAGVTQMEMDDEMGTTLREGGENLECLIVEYDRPTRFVTFDYTY